MEAKQRNVTLSAIAIIALAVAAYMFFGFGKPTKIPMSITAKGVCLACKTECDAHYKLGEEAPFTCKHCGKAAVYPWYFCNVCNKRVIPTPVRIDGTGPLRIEGHPRCPICGTQDISAYDPRLGQQSVGDAPLPEWSP